MQIISALLYQDKPKLMTGNSQRKGIEIISVVYSLKPDLKVLKTCNQ